MAGLKAISVALLVLSGLFFLVGVGAPYIGLGSGEDFLLWKLASLSRSGLARISLTTLSIGLLMAGLVFGRTWLTLVAGNIRARISDQKSHAWLCTAVRWTQVVAQRTHIVWAMVNRNWVVVLVTAPFALHVLAFVYVVLPGTPWVAPDSTTYIAFATHRPFLYPIILRGLAYLSDDPKMLYMIPMVLGTGATLFLAEALQRLIRNAIVSIAVALLILYNWSILELGGLLLTDYPFFVFLTTAIALILVVVRNPKPVPLALLAVVIVLAMWIRPVGFAAVVVVPLLFLVHRHVLVKVLKYFATPFVCAILVVCTVNMAVYDYFGISRFTGYPMAINTMLLLRESTPMKEAELKRRLLAKMKKYHDEYAAEPDHRKRFTRVVNWANPVLHSTAPIVLEYGRQMGVIKSIESPRHAAFVEFLNNSSPLNRRLGDQIKTQVQPDWVWLDGKLTEMAVTTHMHAPMDAFRLTFLKVWFSWRSIFSAYQVPTSFQHHSAMDLSKEFLGVGLTNEKRPNEIAPFLTISGFNRVIETLTGWTRLVSAPFIILLSAFVSIALLGRQLVLRRRATPIITAYGILGILLLFYHLAVSIGHVPLGRFLVVSYAASVPLLFAFLVAVQWVVRHAQGNGDLGERHLTRIKEAKIL